LLCRLLRKFSKSKTRAFRRYADLEPEDLLTSDYDVIYRQLVRFRRVRDQDIGLALLAVWRLKQ